MHWHIFVCLLRSAPSAGKICCHRLVQLPLGLSSSQPDEDQKLTPPLNEETSFSSHFWLTPFGFPGPPISGAGAARRVRLQDLATGGSQRATRAQRFPGKRQIPPPSTPTPSSRPETERLLSVSGSGKGKKKSHLQFFGKLLFSFLSSLGGKQNN